MTSKKHLVGQEAPPAHLVVRGIDKSFGGLQALREADFEVARGEVMALVGDNGAGKSTTLKILTGYLTPTSGSVLINDLNIETHSHEIKKMIGYLPESNPLSVSYTHLTLPTSDLV